MTPRQILIYCFLLLSFIFVNPGRSHAAPQVDQGKVTFEQFIEKIEDRTGYSIAYATNDISVRTVTMPDISGLTAEEALWRVLDRKDYNLHITGQHIIIKKNQAQEQITSTSADPQSPLQATDKIPPPKESVYSGETRLIIIRGKPRNNQSGQPAAIPARSRNRQEDSREETGNYRRLQIENGMVALQPGENAGKHIARRHIPFRTDLLETDVYKRDEEPAPVSRKEKKSTKRSYGGGN